MQILYITTQRDSIESLLQSVNFNTIHKQSQKKPQLLLQLFYSVYEERYFDIHSIRSNFIALYHSLHFFHIHRLDVLHGF